MENKNQILVSLRENLTETAFFVAKGGTTKEVHGKILECLMLLTEFEKGYTETKMFSTDSYTANLENISPKKAIIRELEQEEVNKVTRRLKLWAGHPSQYNAMILTTFLGLQQGNTEPITVDQFSEAFSTMLEEQQKDMYSDADKKILFLKNFAQMKNISSRNHGKVFDQTGIEVSIWAPVSHAVNEYEKKVLR